MTEAMLFCPKCRAEMMGYQRGDIVISQCGFCRGVFVGENDLIRLIDTGGTGLGIPADMVISNGNGNGHGPPRGPYEGRHRSHE
jgi:Zn-finger nucleic acid-binding protein